MNGLAVCLNMGMSVQDNWLANLRHLVDTEAPGQDKRPGFRAVAQRSGLSEEYVYQLYSAKPKADGSPRTVGPKAARALARAFADGRPMDWIDMPVRTQPGGPPPPPRDFEDRHVVSETDWALLDDIKTAATEAELSTIRARAEMVRSMAEREIAARMEAATVGDERPSKPSRLPQPSTGGSIRPGQHSRKRGAA